MTYKIGIFGGTFLSGIQSDNIKPLNIVHKMIECNNGPVAKNLRL